MNTHQQGPEAGLAKRGPAEPAGARPASAVVDLGPLVRTRAEKGVLVVTYTHECLGTAGGRELAEICLGYAEELGGGWTRQALSLGLTRGVTCAGLVALVRISDELVERGGRLALFGVAPHVRAVIRRTGLGGRLTTARGLREAVDRARDDDRRGVLELAAAIGISRVA